MSINHGDEAELLHPWSALALVQGLEWLAEHANASSPTRSNPGQASEGQLLRFWIERRPDVAARALLSILLTDRCFTSRSGTSDGVVQRARDMAQHALRVQREWGRESSCTGAEEVPQGEVTFAAQFMEQLLMPGGTPDVAAVVQAATSPETAGPCGRDAVDDMRCVLLAAHARCLQTMSHTAATPTSPALPMPSRRMLSLRATDDTAPDAAPSLTTLLNRLRRDGALRLGRTQQRTRERGVHGGVAWLAGVSARDRRALRRCLRHQPPSLAARSRMAISAQAAASAARQSSTTLIRGDGATIVAPQWTAPEAVEESTPVPSHDTPVEPNAVPDTAKPTTTVTRVEDGELALVDGRVVVLPARRGRRGRPRTTTRPWRSAEVHGRRGRPARAVAVAEPRVTAVSTQNVSLKTCEELRAMVGQWAISTTLREALLIGLETPSAPGATRVGVLRLQVPTPTPAPSHAVPDPSSSASSFVSETWVASSEEAES